MYWFLLYVMHDYLYLDVSSFKCFHKTSLNLLLNKAQHSAPTVELAEQFFTEDFL